MWKQLIAGAAVFSTSVGVTFLTLKNTNSASSSSSANNVSSWTNNNPYKETAGEKLLGSLLSYEAMDIDGDITITLGNRNQINLKLDGQGSIADINKIKVLANMDLDLAGIPLSGQFSYFTDTMTFSVDEICNFKLKTNDLFDFVSMIPTYGVSVELPDSLANLDTNTLLSKITNLQDDQARVLPTGERFFTVTVGEDEQAVAVDVLADEKNNIKGIKIDKLEYKDTELSLRINLSEITGEQFVITDPLEGEDAKKYQDFKPVFTLVDNLYSLINKNQFGVKIYADLSDTTKKIVDTEVDLNVDKTSNKLGLDISLFGPEKENSEKTKYTLSSAYVDGTIYTKFHNLALSIDTLTISNLIDMAVEQVKDQFSEKLNQALEGGIDTSNIDLNGIVGKIKNVLKKVNVNSSSVDVVINIAEFNEYLGENQVLPEDNIVLTISFSDSKLESISLSTIKVAGYSINFKVQFTDYQEVNIADQSSYVRIEDSDILVGSLIDLIKQKSYYIGLDVETDDNDNTTDDLSMNGYVQLNFNNDNNYGYGDMTIVDNNKYRHHLKADMYNQGNFIFTYNDKMKGSFTSQTIFDIAGIVQDVINNPDEHFYELFGELLEKLNSGTLSRIIAGEYTLALDYEIISNLVMNDHNTSFDVNLGLFGMDDMNLHLDIGYTYDTANYTYADLDYLTISNLKLGDKDVEVTIDFDKYKTDLDSSRLNQFDTYLDFSCIKVLLGLGINTSKFNYYHFTGNLNLNIPLANLDNIGLDARIRNEKGNVTVAIALSNIPIVKILGGIIDDLNLNSVPGYKSTDHRNAYIYYQHFEDPNKTDYWYIDREDKVTEKGEAVSGIIFKKYRYNEYTLHTTRKCTNEYFLNNIVDILLKDVLGVTSDRVLNMINNSDSSSSSSIKYEEILSDFRYSENKHSFFIDINMKALLGTGIINLFEVTIREDAANNILKGIDVKLGVLASIISAEFNLEFENDRSVDVFTRDEEGELTTTPLPGTVIADANEYIANHASQTVDAANTDSSRTLINTYVK